jgi:hypothetical protein
MKKLARTRGFSNDAKKAMMSSPDYFVWWYTAKSMGLVLAVAALAFYAGKASAAQPPKLPQ